MASTEAPRLFSYVVRDDDGAAPNPFWGRCTLVICKPDIRVAASVGDWIVGTGSKNSPAGDTSGRIIYAMQVAKRMTLREYDRFAGEYLPGKIPAGGRDRQRWFGDAIYDYSTDPPSMRPGVHGEESRAKDLRGEYALLGDRFWYFGQSAIPVPEGLRGLIKQGRGHRSTANAPLLDEFVQWIEALTPGRHGDPEGWLNDDEDFESTCARGRCARDDDDDGDEM